jgi:hypothetical protein
MKLTAVPGPLEPCTGVMPSVSDGKRVPVPRTCAASWSIDGRGTVI